VNEQEVREVFERLERLGASTPYEVHPDYVLEMPQSGERIRGRDNMQAYQQAYPNPPTIQLRRVVGAGDVWVVEAQNDYGGGQIYHVIDIVQYRDGKIWRDPLLCRAVPGTAMAGTVGRADGGSSNARRADSVGGWRTLLQRAANEASGHRGRASSIAPAGDRRRTA
jgi:hypothetical protein